MKSPQLCEIDLISLIIQIRKLRLKGVKYIDLCGDLELLNGETRIWILVCPLEQLSRDCASLTNLTSLIWLL